MAFAMNSLALSGRTREPRRLRAVNPARHNNLFGGLTMDLIFIYGLVSLIFYPLIGVLAVKLAFWLFR